MSVQTLIVRDGNGAAYFQGEAFPDKVAPTGHFVVVYEDSGAQFCDWTQRMPRQYDDDEDIEILIDWISPTASSGSVVWQVEIERLAPSGNSLLSDNFDTPQTQTTAVSATLGAITRTTINFSNGQFDNIQENDDFRLRLTRNTGSGSDTLVGDALVVNWSAQSDV